MWLGATILTRANLEHFHHDRKFTGIDYIFATKIHHYHYIKVEGKLSLKNNLENTRHI